MKAIFQKCILCIASVSLLVAAGCNKNEVLPDLQSLEISVETVSASGFKVTVTPSDDSFLWYVSSVKSEVYASYDSHSSFASAMVSNLKYMIDSGVQASELLMKGTKEVSCDGLEENTEYVVYAIGVDEEFNILTDTAIKEVRTIADEQFFVVDFSGITSVGMEAKVTPKDPEMTYVFGVSTKAYVESFDSDDEYIEDNKKWIIETYGSYDKVIASGETYWGASTLTPETEYYAMVYGMTASGEVTTSLFKFGFTTEPVEMVDMSFDVNMNVENNVAIYSLNPSNDSNWYYHTFVKKSDVGEYTYDELFDKLFKESYKSYLAPGLGYTKEDILELVANKGRIETEKTLLAETDWVMLVAGVNNDLLVNTDITTYEFTTGEAHLDYTIKGKVKDITAVSATVEASFTGPMFYYYGLFTKEYVDGFSSDKELLSALDYGEGVVQSYELGCSRQEIGLKPETDYCAVIVGYNEGPATAPAKIYFKTKKEGDVSNADIVINVKPFFSASEVAFAPSDNDILYVCGNITKSEWDGLLSSNGDDENLAVAAIYKNKVDEYLNAGWTLEQALNAMAKSGNNIVTFNWLEQQSEYVAWAIALDSEYEPSDRGSYYVYSTGKREDSDVTAEIVSVKYFQMAELREEFPEASWYEGNSAVIVYEIKPSQGVYHWYSACWYRGDIEQYSDEELFNDTFPFSNGMDKKYGSEIRDWDNPTSFLSFAIDEKGNYGPVCRVTVIPEIAKSSPASEYPRELLNMPSEESSKSAKAAVPHFSSPGSDASDTVAISPVNPVESINHSCSFVKLVRINK